MLQSEALDSARVPGLFLRNGIYWYQPKQKDGVRPPMESLDTRDKAEAIAMVDHFLSTPALSESDPILAEIDAHLEAGFLDRTGQRHEYSRASREPKRTVLREFARGLPRRVTLAGVTPQHLQFFYDRCCQTKSLSSAYKQLMDVRAFFTWARARKKVRVNPVLKVEIRARAKSAHVHIGADGGKACPPELRDKLIIECADLELRKILLLGFHAGMRKRELVEACPQWVKLRQKHFHLSDTPTCHFTDVKKARTIPMKKVLIDFFNQHGVSKPFLVHPEIEHGKSKYRYDFTKPFDQYMAAQGCPWVTPHVMRHTYASLYVMSGTSIFKVARWLGDSLKVTMDTYAHLAPTDSEVDRSL